MKKLIIVGVSIFILGACNTNDQGSSRHSGANADAERGLLQSPNSTERVRSGVTTQSGELTPDSVRTTATDSVENRHRNDIQNR